MVTTKRLAIIMQSVGVPQEQIREVVTALEPKLKPLYELCKKHDIVYQTASYWVKRGYLTSTIPTKGFVRGGGLIHVDEHELLDLLENPPKSGRPSKRRVRH